MQKINIRKLYYHFTHDYLTLNNLVIAVAFAIAASWAWGSVGVMQRNYDLQKEIDSKQRDLQVTELETLSLQLEQKYYQSDEYKELEVRSRLGLVEEGERVLVLPPNTQTAIDSSKETSRPSRTAPVSNFQQWTNFLFGGNSRTLQS